MRPDADTSDRNVDGSENLVRQRRATMRSTASDRAQSAKWASADPEFFGFVRDLFDLSKVREAVDDDICAGLSEGQGQRAAPTFCPAAVTIAVRSTQSSIVLVHTLSPREVQFGRIVLWREPCRDLALAAQSKPARQLLRLFAGRMEAFMRRYQAGVGSAIAIPASCASRRNRDRACPSSPVLRSPRPNDARARSAR